MPTIRTLAAAAPLAALLLAALPPAAHADQRIRCESPDYRYRSCPIREGGEVRLERQLSKTRCVQGRNWGVDRRGIWVDEGCAAEFVVESRWGGGPPPRPGHGGDRPRDRDRQAAYAALGATSPSGPPPGRGRVPGWMTGRFVGYQPQRGVTIDLNVERDGRATARIYGVTVEGAADDGRLWFGNARLDVQRARDGFDTVQIGDQDNRVSYRRR